MAATYLNSWIASKAARRAVAVVSCGALCAVLAYAETLAGVVYFNELGNGTRPVGNFELSVGKTIYSVEYGPGLERHFEDEICNDIGAVWSVEVRYFDGSPYARSVTCAGRTADDIHAPYILVRRYLEGLASAGVPTAGLSSRYRSSPEFKSFARRLASPNLAFSPGWERPATCLRVVSVGALTPTRLATHCGIRLQGRFVELRFDVARNKASTEWEIDGIEIPDSP
jgi:hypothetical protein